MEEAQDRILSAGADAENWTTQDTKSDPKQNTEEEAVRWSQRSTLSSTLGKMLTGPWLLEWALHKVTLVLFTFPGHMHLLASITYHSDPIGE